MSRLATVAVAILVVGSAVAGPAAGWLPAGTGTEPAVEVTVDDSPVADGDRHETHRDDEITVAAEVGDAASANTTLEEIVVRVDGELVESRSVDGTAATETVRPDYDQGNNTVRVIVTDSAGNVNATRFTVFQDDRGPRVRLREPFGSIPWTDIDDGTVNGTNQTIAGDILDDSGIDRIVVSRSFGEQGDRTMISDPGEEFSIPVELGYSGIDNRTNRFRIDVKDEFGNTRSYFFSINVTDDAGPTLSTAPVPNETTRNRIFVAGSVSDDVWIRAVNVTVKRMATNASAKTTSAVGPRDYEYGADGRTATFNESVHLIYPGTYRITVNVTDVTGNETTDQFTVERVRRGEGDLRPTLAVDEDRTVVTGNETLFLAGSAFEGVTSRLVVETRSPAGDTVDYQVVHSGADETRVDFDREVAIVDGRTEVIVRAFDPDGNEVTERFYVNGSTRETFVDSTDDSEDDDEGDDEPEVDYPVVSVTHLQDERAGTASSSVTVTRAPADSTVGLPSADGPSAVATTGNVTLDGLDLSVDAETNLTGTVVLREVGAGDLRGPGDARTAATVSIQHSVPASHVDGLTLVLAVDRSYLAANGFDAQNLTVYRGGDEWTRLETTVVERGDDRVRYRVESPGLSVFSLADAGRPVGDETNETDDQGNETAVDGNETGTDGNETADPGNATTATNETANGTADDGNGGEAQIFVSNVTVNRTAVGVNETVLVNATLANGGNANGTYTATLHTMQGVNRTFVDDRTVTVPPGEERTVQFRTTFAQPGNHTVSVNGTQAGPVVVESGGGGLLSVFAFVPLRLLGMLLGGILGLLLVLVLVRFVLRRVGSTGEEAGG